MTDEARRARNAGRLLECYPTFRARVAKVIAAMEAAGFRPRIQDAWRSPEEQLEAYKTGHSKLRWGFHNATGPKGEKEALAVDLIDDDHPLNSAKAYLLRLAACARDAKLETGILWGLPPRLQQAVVAAIVAGQWGLDLKLGWDPSHLQPIDLTSIEARRGERPS